MSITRQLAGTQMTRTGSRSLRPLQRKQIGSQMAQSLLRVMGGNLGAPSQSSLHRHSSHSRGSLRVLGHIPSGRAGQLREGSHPLVIFDERGIIQDSFRNHTETSILSPSETPWPGERL